MFSSIVTPGQHPKNQRETHQMSNSWMFLPGDIPKLTPSPLTMLLPNAKCRIARKRSRSSANSKTRSRRGLPSAVPALPCSTSSKESRLLQCLPDPRFGRRPASDCLPRGAMSRLGLLTIDGGPCGVPWQTAYKNLYPVPRSCLWLTTLRIRSNPPLFVDTDSKSRDVAFDLSISRPLHPIGVPARRWRLGTFRCRRTPIM